MMFSFGVLLTVDAASRALGLTLMLSASIITGAWMIAAAIERTNQK
ncbi:MAG: hypothetical protein LBK60_03540 [Verrucomicrobiales bacterium]|nr:hypothetical protein [Verrucomicrobiales bacterium]